MHYIVLFFFGAFARVLPWLVAKVLTAFGIGLFTLAGLTVLFNQASGYLTGQIGSLPATIYQLLDTGGYLAGVTIILSAMSTRIAWLATSTVVKKL